MTRQPLIRKTPLRKASTKRAKELAMYRQERDAWLVQNPTCAACSSIWHGPIHAATEVHHIRGRIGRLLRMQKFWLAVCSRCHAWIHYNKANARVMEFIAPATDFNRSPKE